ncbi:MAG: hypothetical protein MUF62_06555 [Chitinophagaceae bacterium]|jgi:hypothetical protein|nr:hypothetical protein [Chitinophagaceae bacterium]
MKTLIASLMALSLSLGNVFANDSVNTTNRKQTETVSNASNGISLEVYNQLLEENKLLRTRVAQLADSAAELQSTLEYNEVMGHMLTGLRKQQASDKQAEMDAQVAYNQLMGNMLLKLKQASVVR